MKTYEYNKDTGESTCIITTNKFAAAGLARLHPDDTEWASEYTGCFIAEARAIISIECKQRDMIKAELDILTHLLDCINSSKKHNKKSYEYKMLNRLVKVKTKELEEIRQYIAGDKEYLRRYIAEKDKFHAEIKAKSN